MSMLLAAGRAQEAFGLRSVLVRVIEKYDKHLPSEAGPVLRALAVTAALSEGLAGQRRWTLRELRHLKRFRRDWQSVSRRVEKKLKNRETQPSMVLSYPFESMGESVTPASWRLVKRRMEEDLDRLAAGAWTNLAIFHTVCPRHELVEGRVSPAGRALRRALDFCELSGDRIALAAIYFAYGNWCASAREEDDALTWLAMAEAAGLTGGNLDAANSAAHRRSDLLLRLGEYRCAEAALSRITQRVSMGAGADLEMRVKIDRLRAEIALRRGHIKCAVANWEHALVLAALNPILVARILTTMIRELSFSAPDRSILVDACDKALALMDQKMVPADGGASGVADRAEIKKWRRSLSATKAQTKPYFLPVEASQTEWELRVRGQLIHAEFRQAHEEECACLQQLVEGKVDEKKFPRALELAEAYLAAAKQAGTPAHEFAARWEISGIRRELGDYVTASKIYQTMLGEIPAHEENLRGIVLMKLAFSQWAIGSFDAQANICDALDIFERIGEADHEEKASGLFMRMQAAPKADVPPAKSTLLVLNILGGKNWDSASSEELEAKAREAFAEYEFGPVRIILFQAIAAYRLERNNAGLARSYKLLADAAKVEGRSRQATELRRKARSFLN